MNYFQRNQKPPTQLWIWYGFYFFISFQAIGFRVQLDSSFSRSEQLRAQERLYPRQNMMDGIFDNCKSKSKNIKPVGLPRGKNLEKKCRRRPKVLGRSPSRYAHRRFLSDEFVSIIRLLEKIRSFISGREFSMKLHPCPEILDGSHFRSFRPIRIWIGCSGKCYELLLGRGII